MNFNSKSNWDVYGMFRNCFNSDIFLGCINVKYDSSFYKVI